MADSEIEEKLLSRLARSIELFEGNQSARSLLAFAYAESGDEDRARRALEDLGDANATDLAAVVRRVPGNDAFRDMVRRSLERLRAE